MNGKAAKISGGIQQQMSEENREKICALLLEGFHLIHDSVGNNLIPTTGPDLVYALPKARSSEDIASIPGRDRIRSDEIRSEEIRFGADTKNSRIILTVIRFDPNIRSTASLLFSDMVLEICEDLLFEICSSDKAREGIPTMDWEAAFCCEHSDGVPDIMYNRGSRKNEGIIRVLGEDPRSVATNIIKICSRIIDTTLSEN